MFKSKFSLEECIIGKVYFVNVNMRVRNIEINLMKVESIGHGSNKKGVTELINKFELVDGSPAAGELVPIRMFLNPESVSPTYKEINNTVSVRYYVKFVITNEDDQTFFKQQEITLWRKSGERESEIRL